MDTSINSLETIAAENFAAWNAALLSGNPEKVADLYDENNSFLPTMAGDLRRGRERAADYFVHFLQKNPAGTVVESHAHDLGDGVYLHAGLYEFEVNGNDGGREIVHARFTYVWHLTGGEWKIVHHHSSVRP